jgi:hypothetical protein
MSDHHGSNRADPMAKLAEAVKQQESTHRDSKKKASKVLRHDSHTSEESCAIPVFVHNSSAKRPDGKM